MCTLNNSFSYSVQNEDIYITQHAEDDILETYIILGFHEIPKLLSDLKICVQTQQAKLANEHASLEHKIEKMKALESLLLTETQS